MAIPVRYRNALFCKGGAIWYRTGIITMSVLPFMNAAILQKIKYVPIGSLIPDEANPRLIRDRQFQVLCESIKKNPDYFETRPILCNAKMKIFAGHMRWLAAKEIGMAEVPVAVMDISEIELLKRDILLLESLDAQFVVGLGYAPEEKFVDHEAIRGELKGLHYPLYFLDYETYSSPIPMFDGTKPWQQVPFQYSLYIRKSKDATLAHKEFIATENKNPIADLAQQLEKDIGDTGSVVVWNATFEATRNKEIAKAYPDYASCMESVNARMFDLMVIFRKKLYTQHKFHRSYSIKNILPVLVPELSYKELAIQEGGTASVSWPILIDEKTPAAEKDELKKNMLLYCDLDTMAMVRILENLEKEIV